MSYKRSFQLPNVGPGPDPFSLEPACEAHEFVLLLFQRDHYCTNCRSQVQSIADRYDEFTDRDALVVSIVPEPREKLHEWQDSYELPFPLCTDPDSSVSDAYDQPVRFGLLGSVSDFLGRMPMAVLLDCQAGDPAAVATHAGSSTWDRPDVDDVLAWIDDRR